MWTSCDPADKLGRSLIVGSEQEERRPGVSVGKKRRVGATPRKIHSLGICPQEWCGKVMYGSRADARKMARKLFPGDHLTAYECSGYWHFGHEPKRVLHGGGWGSEGQLARKAEHLRHETATRKPVTCESCGAEVSWTVSVGYAHDCEVVGLEDEMKGREI
jgi:hypothetical protein